MRAQTRSEIADLLSRHGLRPSHHLGQHFLADANITRRIVEIAEVGAGSRVVEVGAGTGTLTAALAEAGAHVVSYEIDAGLRPVLEEVTEGLEVDLRFEDAMDVDLSEALDGDGWVFVANLPYNVGTPLLLDVVRGVPAIGRFVVMVQREVALRLTADVGSPDYGLPSVVAALYTDASLVMRVPPQVFYPPPRVESAVVTMDRHVVPEGVGRAIELARAGFGQRRKMLRRSLAQVTDDAEGLLERAGVPVTARAEELAAVDFLRLARA